MAVRKRELGVPVLPGVFPQDPASQESSPHAVLSINILSLNLLLSIPFYKTIQDYPLTLSAWFFF